MRYEQAYTNADIQVLYRDAKDKVGQIIILSQLTGYTISKIKQILGLEEATDMPKHKTDWDALFAELGGNINDVQAMTRVVLKYGVPEATIRRTHGIRLGRQRKAEMAIATEDATADASAADIDPIEADIPAADTVLLGETPPAIASRTEAPPSVTPKAEDPPEIVNNDSTLELRRMDMVLGMASRNDNTVVRDAIRALYMALAKQMADRMLG